MNNILGWSIILGMEYYIRDGTFLNKYENIMTPHSVHFVIFHFHHMCIDCE